MNEKNKTEGHIKLGGGFNPFEKCSSKLDHFPKDRGENNKNWNHHLGPRKAPYIYFNTPVLGSLATADPHVPKRRPLTMVVSEWLRTDKNPIGNPWLRSMSFLEQCKCFRKCFWLIKRFAWLLQSQWVQLRGGSRNTTNSDYQISFR